MSGLGTDAPNLTDVLPYEVMLHVIKAGSFTNKELATVRLVSRSMCQVASDHSLYKQLSWRIPKGADDQDLLPAVSHWLHSVIPDFVAGGIEVFDLATADLYVFIPPTVLAAIRDRFPRLVTLAADGLCRPFTAEHGNSLPAGLVNLSLGWVNGDRGQGPPDLSSLSRLTRLECLSVTASSNMHCLDWDRFPALRRLFLPSPASLDMAALVQALAASACAATLEALVMREDSWGVLAQTDGDRWFEFIPGLPALRQLDGGPIPAAGDPDEAREQGALLGQCLGDDVDLTYLSLRGVGRVPATTMVKPMASLVTLILDTLPEVDALPPTLRHLFIKGEPMRGVDVAPLLSQCPALEVIFFRSVMPGAVNALARAAENNEDVTPWRITIGVLEVASTRDLEALLAAGYILGSSYDFAFDLQFMAGPLGS